MSDNGLFQQYQQIKDHKVLVTFKGGVSQDLLNEFGAMIKSSLSAESNTRKIFAVFVELAQNIRYYSAEKESPDTGIGIIVLWQKDDFYYLSSGNLISNQSVEKIREKCNRVNSMNADELKAFYQELIRKERPTSEGSKGAGLGIVDIARRTDGPIECVINAVDDTNSFLTLTALFKKESR